VLGYGVWVGKIKETETPNILQISPTQPLKERTPNDKTPTPSQTHLQTWVQIFDTGVNPSVRVWGYLGVKKRKTPAPEC